MLLSTTECSLYSLVNDDFDSEHLHGTYIVVCSVIIYLLRN